MLHVDPIDAVSALVREAVVSALGTDFDADPQVRRSDRADLQADVAMRLARQAKRAPRAIAEAIVAALPANDVIERIEVANPGFVNIWLRNEWLATAASAANASDRLAVPHSETPERIVIDYSHPNVAKEMHVGHLRSTVIDEAIQRAENIARAKASESKEPIDEATLHEVARMVGVGAIKYADLSSDRVKDYIFDLERMVSFDGNTAGYCQYAHARARSVLRKAGELPADGLAIVEPKERELAGAVLGLGAVVRDVERTLEPHRLVNYSYALASAFTSFYDACPILKADPPVRASRLLLTQLTARTLACALGLLGISVPDRM